MKGQLKAATAAEYLAQLEEPRKSDVAALDAMIRKNAPKLTPFVQMGILAYGPYRYTYPSGRESNWFRIGIASNAGYISMYVMGGVLLRYKSALSKANCGKGCLRFKRLSDLDAAALKKMIRECAAAR
jgi:hypothetical protein